jgi:hypothetical protein
MVVEARVVFLQGSNIRRRRPTDAGISDSPGIFAKGRARRSAEAIAARRQMTAMGMWASRMKFAPPIMSRAAKKNYRTGETK